MTEEDKPLIRNQIGNLVPLPSNHHPFKCNRVYVIKKVTNGLVNSYKEWFLAKGFQQVHGTDYDETFALNWIVPS